MTIVAVSFQKPKKPKTTNDDRKTKPLSSKHVVTLPFRDEDRRREFDGLVGKLMDVWSIDNVTDAVVEAVRFAHRQLIEQEGGQL